MPSVESVAKQVQVKAKAKLNLNLDLDLNLKLVFTTSNFELSTPNFEP